MKKLIFIPFILSILFSGCYLGIPDFIIEQEKEFHRNEHYRNHYANRYDYKAKNKNSNHQHKHSQTIEGKEPEEKKR